MDKWGASATKATAAQSKIKIIEKMKKEGKLTPPSAGAIQQRFLPSLVIPPPTKAMGDTLIQIKGGDFGYDSIIAKDVNLEITRGMKLILRGANGSGKSTLMAVLRGDLELRGGEIFTNEGLRLGSFTQDLAQQLDVNARAVDLVTAHARGGQDGDITISDERARSAMGRLGLRGDKVGIPRHFHLISIFVHIHLSFCSILKSLRKVGELSGGVRSVISI